MPCKARPLNQKQIEKFDDAFLEMFRKSQEKKRK